MFYARPVKKSDGSTDLLEWEAGIPGPVDTDWANAVYKVFVEFIDYCNLKG